ncbi:MAG TPA: leucyl/phenylalanyl-tRNA--protein transferase [Thermoanaerobaculia bacterium]|nr:leucyl/phenylalanyl-tRNA--protein transferase [Thermoanaerobaculia bacterium]
MPPRFFPDPRSAPSDIVAIGGELDWLVLLDAYRHGIFPWPIEKIPLTWFSPKRRAIVRFADLHVGRSLQRQRRRQPFRLTIDRAFRQVIEACSVVPRPGQDGTWITREIIEAYCDLHDRGHAHSVEAWDGDRLVGGIYGVDAGGAFGGESMFFIEPDASKLALLHLADHLSARGLSWMDIQVMTPHMKSLGARTLARAAFLDLLEKEQSVGRTLFPKD